MYKLKIDTAEDLIQESAPGHIVCGKARSIKWGAEGIEIICGCGLDMVLGFDYLASTALEALAARAKRRPRKKGKNLRRPPIASRKKTSKATLSKSKHSAR